MEPPSQSASRFLYLHGPQLWGKPLLRPLGDRLPSLPGNFGDNVSSIQLFGGGRIQVFNNRNYSNGSTTLNRSVADLRNVPFRGGHTWNNRISSMIVY